MRVHIIGVLDGMWREEDEGERKIGRRKNWKIMLKTKIIMKDGKDGKIPLAFSLTRGCFLLNLNCCTVLAKPGW